MKKIPAAGNKTGKSRTDATARLKHPQISLQTTNASRGDATGWWSRSGLVNCNGETLPKFWLRQRTELFVAAAVLMMAFEGEQPDFKSGFLNYLNFVATGVGLSLACCASEARVRGPQSWATFCASLKLEGIHEAVARWTIRIHQEQSKDALEGFVRALRDGPILDDEVDFWRWLRGAEVGDDDVMPELLEAYARFKDTERKASRRNKRITSGTKRANKDPFRVLILRDWLIEALWCRPTKGILVFLPERLQGRYRESVRENRSNDLSTWPRADAQAQARKGAARRDSKTTESNQTNPVIVPDICRGFKW